ncbi:MAG TPA: sugar transferase [Kiritimatiellia bacterium]|nr:sugar transferase [Kiritimatiellia bacterium]
MRRVSLLSGDLVAIAGSIWLSAILRLGLEEGSEYIQKHVPSLVGSAGLILLCFYAGGMYERQALTRKSQSYRLPLVTVVLSMMLIVVAFYAKADYQIGRGILLLAGVFVFLASWLMRHMYSLAVGQGLLSKNTLVVGEGRPAHEVVRLISATPDAGFKVLGVVSSKRVPPGTFVGPVPVVGTTDSLRELVDAFEAETVVVASSMAREPALLRLLRPLRCSGTEVLDYIAIHELLSQEIPLDHVNDEWLMNAAMNGSVIHIRKIKRIMDVAAAVVGLILTAPILLVAAALVRVDSPGPILYRQRRSGLDGRVFTLIKFRTMREDAESGTGAVWADARDSRVTRTGHFFRKWRIDELPQLWNVLNGDMSLVGPRPERPEFVETLSSAIPFYKERLHVPPGITGWAQVKYPYAASIDAARRKLQFDLYYIKHMGFFLDTMIVLRTVKSILVGLRHHADEDAGGGSTRTTSPESTTVSKARA